MQVYIKRRRKLLSASFYLYKENHPPSGWFSFGKLI